MPIINKQNRKPEIDISGPAGNAYVLLGYAQSYCKQLNISPEPIIERMRAGDYENLLKVFDDEFGEYVNLVR